MADAVAWREGVLPICSHTRTGTHYLAKLLWLNLETGADHYEQLHYSHSRTAPAPYLHLYRDALPVMLSIWRCREHSGVAKEVTFGRMLREPWADLPKSERGFALFNGERDDRVCHQRPFAGTVLDRWVELTHVFAYRATLSVNYTLAVEQPLAVVQEVSAKFKLPRKASFTLTMERIGWQPVVAENPKVTLEDLQLIAYYQRKLCV